MNTRFAILAISLILSNMAISAESANNLTVMAKSVRSNGTVWLATEVCRAGVKFGHTAMFAAPDNRANVGCWRVDKNKVYLELWDMSDPDSKQHRTITKRIPFVDPIKDYVRPDGTAWQPMPTKALSDIENDRKVKGWGDDPGWQWGDADLREFDSKWRAVNLASPIDCTSISLSDARIFERGFVGMVVHLRDKEVPIVFMVRDNVKITLMPSDLATCRAKATQITVASEKFLN